MVNFFRITWFSFCTMSLTLLKCQLEGLVKSDLAQSPDNQHFQPSPSDCVGQKLRNIMGEWRRNLAHTLFWHEWDYCWIYVISMGGWKNWQFYKYNVSLHSPLLSQILLLSSSQYWPLIGEDMSRDQNTGPWLVEAFPRLDPGSELTPSWWLGRSWPQRVTIHSHWAFSSLAGHTQTENTHPRSVSSVSHPMVSSHQWQVSIECENWKTEGVVHNIEQSLCHHVSSSRCQPWTIARWLVSVSPRVTSLTPHLPGHAL